MHVRSVHVHTVHSSNVVFLMTASFSHKISTTILHAKVPKFPIVNPYLIFLVATSK